MNKGLMADFDGIEIDISINLLINYYSRILG